VTRAASKSPELRIVVYGVTGQLGRELVEELEASRWKIAELAGVASPESFGREFAFRGEDLDVLAEAPALKGRDLVIVCTPRGPALEIVREALRAEVPCIDCSGALFSQAAVPLAHPDAPGLEAAPLVGVPASTVLAWRPVFAALAAAGAGVSRLSATILSSAGAWGGEGVAALSDESIALFNQSEPPAFGPAGRPVAFDVAPGGALDLERVRSELAREHGDALRIALSTLQVPTFVGEGAQLALELARPLGIDAARGAFAERAEAVGDLVLDDGTSLRDAVGAASVRVGSIEADPSAEAGRGLRLWLACDPLRLVADAALRTAARTLGISD